MRGEAAAPLRQRDRGAARTRVLIVDDSIVARAVLARTLEREPDFEIVGQAGSGTAAIDYLGRGGADLILLDLEMPGMSGLEALPELIARGKGARILIVSSACGIGAAATIRALQLGAADTLLKPSTGGLAGSFVEELVDRLRRLAATPPAQPRLLQPVPNAPPLAPAPADAAAPACIAIGASTGGVHALATFFAALPPASDVPILVTQHLPAPFMPYFAGQLHEMSGRPAVLAASGMTLRPGTILLAPGDGHIGLVRSRDTVHVRIDRQPSRSGCMPSVDPMMAGVAAMFGPAGLGIMLSGMGRDGLTGAGALVAAGGRLFAQDASSSVVWGMPGAVASAGLAHRVLPPAQIAGEVGALVAPSKGTSAWK